MVLLGEDKASQEWSIAGKPSNWRSEEEENMRKVVLVVMMLLLITAGTAFAVPDGDNGNNGGNGNHNGWDNDNNNNNNNNNRNTNIQGQAQGQIQGQAQAQKQQQSQNQNQSQSISNSGNSTISNSGNSANTNTQEVTNSGNNIGNGEANVTFEGDQRELGTIIPHQVNPNPLVQGGISNFTDNMPLFAKVVPLDVKEKVTFAKSYDGSIFDRISLEDLEEDLLAKFTEFNNGKYCDENKIRYTVWQKDSAVGAGSGGGITGYSGGGTGNAATGSLLPSYNRSTADPRFVIKLFCVE